MMELIAIGYLVLIIVWLLAIQHLDEEVRKFQEKRSREKVKRWVGRT